MIGIIYKYTSPSGKSYIGQTIREKTRMIRHKKSINSGIDTKFIRAIHKYGFENFSYERLFIIHSDDKHIVKEKLNYMEKYYIRKYDTFNNGYNMTLGGDGGSGTKHTEEFKQRQSERMKKSNPAFNMNDEWREKISKSQKGKTMPDSMKEKTARRMKENNPMKNPEVVARMLAKRKITLLNKKLLNTI